MTIQRAKWRENWWVLVDDAGRYVMAGGAVIQGPREDWVSLRAAILEGSSGGGRRCRVVMGVEDADLWSPRNSIAPLIVSRAEADTLAASITRAMMPTQDSARRTSRSRDGGPDLDMPLFATPTKRTARRAQDGLYDIGAERCLCAFEQGPCALHGHSDLTPRR